MSDVVQRLRSVAAHLPECASGHGACLAGADEIERLRAALKMFVDATEGDYDTWVLWRIVEARKAAAIQQRRDASK